MCQVQAPFLLRASSVWGLLAVTQPRLPCCGPSSLYLSAPALELITHFNLLYFTYIMHFFFKKALKVFINLIHFGRNDVCQRIYSRILSSNKHLNVHLTHDSHFIKISFLNINRISYKGKILTGVSDSFFPFSLFWPYGERIKSLFCTF